MALFFQGGIGDIFMMGSLGFCLGAKNIIYLIIFSCIAYLLLFTYRFICKRNKNIEHKKRFDKLLKQQMPFAPSVLIGYIATYIITLFL
jgi:prepilin signal peptidase PulO-like enzyme (type II secretory pathway)